MPRSALVLGLAVSALAAVAHATTARLAPHQELIASSELIVEGRAGAPESFWQGGRIFTRWRVEVSEVLLGDPAAAKGIEVLSYGGIVNGVGQSVAGAPRLVPGQRLLLYLTRGQGGWLPVGLWQGVFSVTDDGTANPRLSRPDVDVLLAGPSTIDLPPDLASARRAIELARRSRR